jgi:hypothetical protein
MLVGQLPDLRETQSGKDLIAIGKAEGKAEGLLRLLEIRFGEVPAALREGIQKINSDERIDSLYELALNASKLSDFKL